MMEVRTADKEYPQYGLERLSSGGRRLLAGLAARFAGQPFEMCDAERCRPPGMSLAELRLHLAELEYGGWVVPAGDIRLGARCRIPADRLAAAQSLLIGGTPGTAAPGGVRLEEPAGRGLTADLLLALLLAAEEGLPLTGKRLLHKRWSAKLEAALSFGERHLEGLPKDALRFGGPAAAAFAAELLTGLGLLEERGGKLHVPAGPLAAWLRQPEPEQADRLYRYIGDRFGGSDPWLQHFRLLLRRPMLRPGEWFALADIEAALAEAGITGRLTRAARRLAAEGWLRALAGFGWTETGMLEDGGLVFRWTERKPPAEREALAGYELRGERGIRGGNGLPGENGLRDGYGLRDECNLRGGNGQRDECELWGEDGLRGESRIRGADEPLAEPELPADSKLSAEHEPSPGINGKSSSDHQTDHSLYPQEAQFIVEPNFDVWVPPDVPPAVRWTLACCAELLSAETLWRFRLSREALERAARLGFPPEQAADWLAARAEGGLPPGVDAELRRWGRGIGRTELSRVLLLSCTQAEDAEQIAGHPRLAPYLSRLGALHFTVAPEAAETVRRELAEAGLGVLAGRDEHSSGSRLFPTPVPPEITGPDEGGAEDTAADQVLAERGAGQIGGFLSGPDEFSASPSGLTNSPTDRIVGRAQRSKAAQPGEGAAHKNFAGLLDPEELFPGLRSIPAAWTGDWRTYHRSTSRQLMEQALDWGTKVRLSLGGEECLFLPAGMTRSPWRVTGLALDASGENPRGLSLGEGDWQEIQIVLPQLLME